MSAVTDRAMPTESPPDAAGAALGPLREALRAAAAQEAEELLAAARRDAASMVAEAAAEAARISRDAAARGTDDAEADARLRSSRARRTAREAVLAAQEGLRLELLRALGPAASAAQTDARYPALLERLRREAAAVLGPGAEVAESPQGGVVAAKGTRRLDLSLPALALRRAEESAMEVSDLWRE